MLKKIKVLISIITLCLLVACTPNVNNWKDGDVMNEWGVNVPKPMYNQFNIDDIKGVNVKVKQYYSQLEDQNIIIIDYAVTISTLILLYSNNILTQNMIYGIAGSLVVDIFLVGVPYIYKSKIGRWHENRQHHLEQPYSFATDLIVIAISAIIIFIL